MIEVDESDAVTRTVIPFKSLTRSFEDCVASASNARRAAVSSSRYGDAAFLEIRIVQFDTSRSRGRVARRLDAAVPGGPWCDESPFNAEIVVSTTESN
jgi:hypothetical protein